MSFRKKIGHNDTLMSGLASRGYFLCPLDDDENHCTFLNNSTADVSVTIVISIWDRVTFRCGLLIASRGVGQQLQCKGLIFDDHVKSADSHEVVAAVELLWLRWNDDPQNAENYRNDYSYVSDAGSRRFFEDLDTVGQRFISSIASASQLAIFLENLDVYPVHIKFGGAPGSSDRFLYAALLYIDSGDLEAARRVLDRGALFLGNGSTDVQVRRYHSFMKRRQLLLS
ncbi:hypothetical protein [Burkholderia sp. LMU1-1-1.1]|uniref:hypothetical protein n=1 Tax=Burkholderia sp. LMU1-1-1.1 TaxID=3135266 RepID=UPI00342AC82E